MKISFKSIPAIVLLAALFSVTLNIAMDAPLVIGFTAAVLLSFVPMPKGASFMALQKEIWRNDIVGNLFKNNEFSQFAVNADTFVLGGTVVHIPVAGSASSVKKNLASFPQVATERADSELTYPLDTLYSLPRRIAQIDKYELSYDKRMSVVGEDVRNLTEKANNSLLFRWGPVVAQTILTTGALSANDLIDGTATGNRRAFDKAEIKRVAKMFNRGDLPGRPIALLTAAHYHQFFESLSDAEKTNFGRIADLAKGIVGEYMGVKIMMRSSVLRYRGADGAYVKIDEGDDAFAANAADRAASLVWTEGSVERALGDVEVFDNQAQALYYGDIFSAMLRIGGRIRRTAGVIAIVEANA
ncbi:MAG: hypothetical protein QM768_21780 [Agriterribacter sp.]